MITKYAMVVLAGYPDMDTGTSMNTDKKENKPSLFRRIAPGLGAFTTMGTGHLIRRKYRDDAFDKLYPKLVNTTPESPSMTYDDVIKPYSAITNTYNELKNDNSRMGKLNYFIAKQLLRKPAARVQPTMDTIKNDMLKSKDHSINVSKAHFNDIAEMYSVMKNPKLNALGYGMSKALPWYMTYKIAKILYGLGKGALGSNKKKIFNKEDQFAGAGAELTA
jgi:hypothetical protein